MKFYCHPTCTTCKKAQKWLDERSIAYEWINLKETSLSKEEWIELLEKTDRPIKQFFNTSGQVYREMNLKERVPNLTIQEAADLLSQDGMLVKRPLAFDQYNLTVGFKEAEYETVWEKEKESQK
ncbi:Spx/MgsR family RNA polymerase-binding regulatory protein [Marinilactibacillus sp. Marseille-P9653]|uniref:Spx/MgsR family RNA polymerase-binding regulatory protein n=1 Tax=Marinilactibacillus sp. Marseille-P9653 TaxID=2866583 RepID=UPI001CE4883F|nr:Spx/MgsR family RNA polymerase-binding regulatory protein [Marinilactibacillus sp. Marseille-P9653]